MEGGALTGSMVADEIASAVGAVLTQRNIARRARAARIQRRLRRALRLPYRRAS